MTDLNQKENAYQSIKEMIVHGDLQMGQNVSDRFHDSDSSLNDKDDGGYRF